MPRCPSKLCLCIQRLVMHLALASTAKPVSHVHRYMVQFHSNIENCNVIVNYFLLDTPSEVKNTCTATTYKRKSEMLMSKLTCIYIFFP